MQPSPLGTNRCDSAATCSSSRSSRGLDCAADTGTNCRTHRCAGTCSDLCCAQAPSIIKTVTTGFNLDITGFVNSQFFTTAVEASATQVVGSLLHSQEFVAPVYNHTNQEQIVATVQPHVRFQEIPEVQVVQRIQGSQTTLNTSSTSTSSDVPAATRAATATTTPVGAQVVGPFPLLQDFAAPVYNQVHQEQIVETIEVIPQERFQQCTIAPIMQGVTREHFHNDKEHSSRRKVRFAAEDDIQFITASSLRAEISDLTRTLVRARNDIAQWEREGFLVPHLHQQCDDFEAQIAVLSREQSSSSSPSSPKKAQVVALSRPFDGHVSRHRLTKHWEGDPYRHKCSLSTLLVVQIFEYLHGGNPYRRVGEN